MGNIYELWDTYEDCIAVQKQVIACNRQKLMKAEKELNFSEIRRLRYLLNILYDEKSELEERCRELKEYAG